MASAQQKIQQFGKTYIHFSSGLYLSGFATVLSRIDHGVVISNENSMVDTERIDQVHEGKVGSQAVNLEDMTGNERVLEVVKTMLSKPNVTYFPGTLLRDFGGYALPVMPVIQQGKLVLERIKQTGIPYVDNPTELARNLIGDKYAKKVKGDIGAQWKEPIKTLNETLEAKVAEQRKQCLKAVEVNGLSVLPIICNELTLMPDLYKGGPIDVIVYSADFLHQDNNELLERCQETLKVLKEGNQLKDPTILVVAKGGAEPYKGTFIYEGGKLRKN